MNRDDLLKRCVDRRVAHETSVVAVSHLFYVYLLSALKKGQRVEVPNFGTFGTHVVGVKRQRRMPFFEVENDLADKVNERYRNLKSLLVGKFELTPVEGEVEYEGAEPPFDPLAEKLGREVILDTSREVTTEDFRRQQQAPPAQPVTPKEEAISPPISSREEPVTAEPEFAPPSKEKKLMPKLNLRGEGSETPPPIGTGPETEPLQSPEPPPTLREISSDGGPSPLLQILLGLIILGAITFALNYFGIIHLWGKKTVPQTTEETLPPIVQPPPQAEETVTTKPESLVQKPPEQTPLTTKQPPVTEKEETKQPPQPQQKEPQPQPVVPAPSTGAGNFTIQVASLATKGEAKRVVSRLAKSGFDGYVSEAFVKGRKWFRVRVGRFATAADAQGAASKLRSANENGVWVTKFE